MNHNDVNSLIEIYEDRIEYLKKCKFNYRGFTYDKPILKFQKILNFLNSDNTYDYKMKIYGMYQSGDDELRVLSLEIMQQINGK